MKQVKDFELNTYLVLVLSLLLTLLISVDTVIHWIGFWSRGVANNHFQAGGGAIYLGGRLMALFFLFYLGEISDFDWLFDSLPNISNWML